MEYPINNLKDSQELLVKLHDNFLNLFLSNHIAMCITTVKEVRFIRFNQECLDLFGYSSNEMTGKTPDEIKLWVDHNKADKAIRQFLKDDKTKSLDFIIRVKDGKTKEIVFSLYRMILIWQKEPVLFFMFQDISELKNNQRLLTRMHDMIAEQKLILEQKNAALREVISYIEFEKNKIKEDVVANVELLMPMIAKIKLKGGDESLLDLVKQGLLDLVSSFGRKIAQGALKLTSREIEICNMVKGGLTTKEIARTLFISSQTIDKHRNNIRRKIGLSNTTLNLVTHLKQLR